MTLSSASPSALDEISAPRGEPSLDRAWFPALDGLRALAVAAVVCLHLQIPYLGGGKFAVTAFFVLSGYLITTGLMREHSRFGRIGLRGFWARRCRRLGPALGVVLVLGLTLSAMPWHLAGSRTASPASFLESAAFSVTQTLNLSLAAGQVRAYELVPTWSLNVEEQFYLVWALVAVAACWRLRRCGWSTHRIARFLTWWVALAGIASLAWGWWLNDHGAPAGRVDFATDTQFGPILIGSALALFCFARSAALARVLRGRACDVLACIALLAVLDCLLNYPIQPDLRTWGPIAVTLGTALLIAVIVSPNSTDGGGGAVRLLAAPALVWVGRRSYGIYLFHVTWLQALGGPGGWQRSMLVIACTLVTAAASYRLVEQRAMRPRANRPADVNLPHPGEPAHEPER